MKNSHAVMKKYRYWHTCMFLISLHKACRIFIEAHCTEVGRNVFD